MTTPSHDVLLTTTDGVEGRTIIRYLGPVFSEHVHSSGWVRGLADDVRHALEDRSHEVDSDLLSGRAAAAGELRRHAGELQAHAVVAARFSIKVLRGGVVATLGQGTAVLLDAPVVGGWVGTPTGSADHPVVAELRQGPARLSELSTRMDVDVDWLDVTLGTLEDAGTVTMDADGRWHPTDEAPVTE